MPVTSSVRRTFPATRISLVAALASPEEATRKRAFDVLTRVYHAPIVALIRLRWHFEADDAEDLAQEFLAEAFVKKWLARYDPARARFRTYLRSCLLAFAATRYEASRRLKRGGGAPHVSLDAAHDVPDEDSLDAAFEQEWRRGVLSLALEEMRAECGARGRLQAWDVFAAYDVAGSDDAQRPTYAALADGLGIPATQVTNHLHWARARFRQHVLDTLRRLAANDEEYRADVRALIGHDA